jgi:hypothetical protein
MRDQAGAPSARQSVDKVVVAAGISVREVRVIGCSVKSAGR